MLDRLEQMEQRFNELSEQMGQPEIINDHEKYQKAGRALRELTEPVAKYRELKEVMAGLAEARAMLSDPDMKEMAEEEIAQLAPREPVLLEEIKILLLPKDPNDEKNVILEIRAGTGGDEASLFAAEIFRMYQRFAEQHRWKIEVLSMSESGVGGYKEVIAIIEGDRVYSQMKWESGVHRVQRVPATETQGRVHTSAITVAVLPEAEEVDVKIEAKDIRIDTDPAASRSTPRIRPSASPTCPPTPWSAARTRSRRSRTAKRACASSVPASTSRRWIDRTPNSPRHARTRWALATARRRSVPTTSRRTGSATTASGSPCTGSTR